MNDNKKPSGGEFVTMAVGGQSFGIPVAEVRDVLRPQPVARIPLAPDEIAGSLNLRGRIVTAIDMRKRLALPPPMIGEQGMNVVVEHKGELFSLIVDTVGDVMSLPMADCEPNPDTLDAQWSAVSDGIYRLKDMLMVALNLQHLLAFADKQRV